jgi:PIN domain nuclease of toxin-antitoxin system
MRILLDTHVWLWILADPERLASATRDRLADRANDLYLSAASAWEIALKYQLGKLPLPCPPGEFVPQRLERDGVRSLAVETGHALQVCRLPPLHRDPFDRLLVAQARVEGMRLYTADEQVLAYGGDILRA